MPLRLDRAAMSPMQEAREVLEQLDLTDESRSPRVGCIAGAATANGIGAWRCSIRSCYWRRAHQSSGRRASRDRVELARAMVDRGTCSWSPATIRPLRTWLIDSSISIGDSTLRTTRQ